MKSTSRLVVASEVSSDIGMMDGEVEVDVKGGSEIEEEEGDFFCRHTWISDLRVLWKNLWRVGFLDLIFRFYGKD